MTESEPPYPDATPDATPPDHPAPSVPAPEPGYWEQQAAAPYPQQPVYGHQQPGYGQPYAPYGPYAAPNHPKATTALVLGLVSTVGAFMCLLPAIAGPFAIVVGLRARQEIRQSQGQVGGDGMAIAGLVLGIIGTVLLTLMVLAVVALVILAIASPSINDGSGATV